MLYYCRSLEQFEIDQEVELVLWNRHGLKMQ